MFSGRKPLAGGFLYHVQVELLLSKLLSVEVSLFDLEKAPEIKAAKFAKIPDPVAQLDRATAF